MYRKSFGDTSWRHGLQGYFIAYDITNMKTFEACKDWIRQMERNCSKNLCKVLIGCKCDLVRERQVETRIAQDFAHTYHMPFFETSAKTGTNIEEAFSRIAREMIKVFADTEGKGEQSTHELEPRRGKSRRSSTALKKPTADKSDKRKSIMRFPFACFTARSHSPER